jgi:hypothetical protein
MGTSTTNKATTKVKRNNKGCEIALAPKTATNIQNSTPMTAMSSTSLRATVEERHRPSSWLMRPMKNADASNQYDLVDKTNYEDRLRKAGAVKDGRDETRYVEEGGDDQQCKHGFC